MKRSLFAIVILSVFACIAAQLQGSVSSNPAGGSDVNLAAIHRVGDQNSNVGGGVFAAGNTAKGPVTTGAFLDANRNGHGLTLQHTNTPGVGNTLSEKARVNLFNDQTNKIDANAFHSRTNMDNGLKFDRVGGGFDYNHAAGHGASLSASRIPQFDRNSIDLTGKANLWRSADRATTLDLTGTASRSFGGGFPARNDFGAGLGITHMFG